ncbi:PLP-dependent aminotransferase family protein [Paraburkholderia sabiae]|uniref:PLP-dependent aminotransferase family protein n=1 Tax=Paraburkholderia sabiae TaxID=273251 RepID=A0ABU9QRJ4_9BURK|nr:PLP-dependent aminotransferase family protein [Paraburkholderia sabiae]WJZ79529.1 PLP-dependent aminotransferase family protein [Paraburkholderia sabiae]CAD6562973.1 2-aminoadipate transaminase [Paraburkholderia sabiae]
MYPFTAPYASPTGSPIRELFRYLGEPGMISLAGGYPAVEQFDADGLKRAMDSAWSMPERCLQYGPTDGLCELKDEVIALMRRRGAICSADELLVTTGSQQGFDLLLRILVAPGDTVLTEQPAYPATLQALRLQQANIVTVPVDEFGIDTEHLASLLDSGSVKAPKLLYTVPTFANPTGATLSQERRLALLQLSAKYRFILIEDEPYGDLRFTGEAVPSLLSLSQEVPGAREWVVYFGSLSKIVAPGLRIGWTIGSKEIVRRCIVAKQTIDLCSSPMTQAIAAAYLAQGSLENHLPRITAAYQRKCEVLCDEMSRSLKGLISYHRPQGGMFVWARCETGNSSILLQHAIERRVLFVPGRAFYADRIDNATLRLSYTAPTISEIRTGIHRLAMAMEALSAGAPNRENE